LGRGKGSKPAAPPIGRGALKNAGEKLSQRTPHGEACKRPPERRFHEKFQERGSQRRRAGAQGGPTLPRIIANPNKSGKIIGRPKYREKASL